MVTKAEPNPSFILLRQGLAFVALFFLLQFGWQCLRGTSVEHAIIHYATVRPAAFLINLLTPDVHVQAVEFSLNAGGGGLNILNGCEGMDALVLLIAAFAVVPLSWSARGWGIFYGSCVVFAANQLRILILFYVSRSDRSLFEQIHAIVAPIVVILIVSGYFYVWLVYIKGRDASPV